MAQSARSEIVLAVDSFRRGNLDEAVERCEALLRRQPRDFGALHLLGVVLGQQGHLDRAGDCLARAVALDPKSAQARRNLGVTLAKLGRHEAAIASFDQALAIGGDPAGLLGELGRSLLALDRRADAVETFGRAIKASPGRAGPYNDLAVALAKSGRHGEALAACREGLTFKADHPGLLGIHALTQLRCCDWSELDRLSAELIDLVVAKRVPVAPFALLAVTDDPDVHLACARNYARTLPSVRPAPPVRPARPGGKLRLAYLSADFSEHATAYLMVEMFERHDRSKFEVIALSHGRDDGSAMRKRLEKSFDRFLDVARDDDATVAGRIRDEGIGILVDLKGHTQDNRLAILASRPAPILVHYLGYPGTLGTDFVDYMIVDAVVAPPGAAGHFTENLVRLPGSYQVNAGSRALDGLTRSRADCDLPADGFVFCCFNNSYKITPPVFGVWMRLLRSVPRSVLWLLADNAAAHANLRREAAARGVDPDRLVFAPRRPQAEHLARHRLADLFLDTLPYNAHTTASDALWAGLPVLTCAGRDFAARVAASLLHAVGLPEMITTDLDDYERLALRLATDPGAMGAVRRKLADNLRSAPLYDTARTTRSIEAAYLEMWGIHQRGEAPRAFAVE